MVKLNVTFQINILCNSDWPSADDHTAMDQIKIVEEENSLLGSFSNLYAVP